MTIAVVTDLLLLNATNLPWRPIFPYAFAQVSAVARRNGLNVKVLDLLDIPADRREQFLASHITAARPRMIGLHIRQGDSVFLDDYFAPVPGSTTTRDYFPIEDNRTLVAILRRLTTAPIIAGGFGFTTHATRLFDFLGVDYGVNGDPDDVIAHFEDLVAGGELARIQSLIYRDPGGIRVNTRGYYSPFEDREYTDAMCEELVRFYGHAQLFGANPPTVAVEVMRGCPFGCFFCTEPHVKGRGLRYRELDVIEAELDYLMSKHIRRFWLVCSELDMQGTRFALTLAERIVKLRERHDLAVEWSAYSLPRLREDELRVLQRAGYAGALNDVLSLDDNNLRRARVPYRSKQAIAFLKAVTKLDREETISTANAAVAEDKVRAGLTQRTPKELASILGLFLGNAHATPATLSITLRRIEDEGLRENYRAALAFPATRVFELDGEPICETTPRGLRTFSRTGETSIDLIQPTFYFQDFLIERLGHPTAIIELLRYAADTFMSTAHRHRKDWSWFLSNHTSVERFRTLLAEAGPRFDADPIVREVSEDPSEVRLRALFAPAAAVKPAWNAAAKIVIEHVIASRPTALERVRAALELSEGLSEYRVTEILYRRFESRDAIVAAVAPRDDMESLCLDWVLFANNVILRPEYRDLLFGSGPG